MEKRIKHEPGNVETPYWLNESMSERLSAEDSAKRDAKEVSEKHKSEIAKKVFELTHNA